MRAGVGPRERLKDVPAAIEGYARARRREGISAWGWRGTSSSRPRVHRRGPRPLKDMPEHDGARASARGGGAPREKKMSKIHIQTTINGEPTEFLCEPHDSLLTALRNSIGLTGTKEGCTTGDCGACSVILDGRLVPACLVLAPEAEGRTLTTIEGIADGE